jgi:hypothetical protein
MVLSIPERHGTRIGEIFQGGKIPGDSARQEQAQGGFMFFGDPKDLSCKDAADADNTGDLALTDAVVSLGWQFLGDPLALPSPGALACGPDPADPQDDFPSCNSSVCQ